MLKNYVTVSFLLLPWKIFFKKTSVQWDFNLTSYYYVLSIHNKLPNICHYNENFFNLRNPSIISKHLSPQDFERWCTLLLGHNQMAILAWTPVNGTNRIIICSGSRSLVGHAVRREAARSNRRLLGFNFVSTVHLTPNNRGAWEVISHGLVRCCCSFSLTHVKHYTLVNPRMPYSSFWILTFLFNPVPKQV